MFTVSVLVTVLAAVALTLSATADFVRSPLVLASMVRAGVPESWLMKLGILKALGALGLLFGIGVSWIGVAAAVGVILFFVGAVITHLRARWYSLGYPSAFLLLGAGSMVSRLATY